MKKTITITSKPICAQHFNGKGTASIVEACSTTVEQIAKIIYELDPKIKIQFINQIDETTPCNFDRFLFYVEASKVE